MSNATEHHGRGAPEARRTIWADTTQLYSSAHAWEWDVALQLLAASTQARQAGGGGHCFGAALAPLGRRHDAFVEHVVALLEAGSAAAAAMGRGLRRTADDWVRTDQGAAEHHDWVRSVL